MLAILSLQKKKTDILATHSMIAKIIFFILNKRVTKDKENSKILSTRL